MGGRSHFYKWNGSAWVEQASIGGAVWAGGYCVGKFGSSSNTALGVVGESSTNFGVQGVSVDNAGVRGDSTNYAALYGRSTNDCGVYGYSVNTYGGIFYGAKGGIQLAPSTSAAAPTHSAGKGALWLTSACVLYVNTDGGTTWQKVGAQ